MSEKLKIPFVKDALKALANNPKDAERLLAKWLDDARQTGHDEGLDEGLKRSSEPVKRATLPEPKRPANTCNRHSDCAEANRLARLRYDEEMKKPWRERNAAILPYTDHCYDECCEDCFGS